MTIVKFSLLQFFFFCKGIVINVGVRIIPLAFSIVDLENDAYWKYFFEQLNFLLKIERGLVINYNRHINILKGVLDVFPSIQYCVRVEHLLNRVKLSFKDSLIEKLFRQ